MSDIPPDLADRMMIKCGRRCCICRRYRPTKLQVHHIHEKAKGGSDEEDNLIVICLSCHTDVHTKVPFARRFSDNELKGHREALVRQVAAGILPSEDTDDTDEVVRQVVQSLRASPRPTLTERAVEILVSAVNGEGDILHCFTTEGTEIVAGGKVVVNSTDNRLVAAYKHGIRQLVQAALIEPLSESCYEVTYEGYLYADELITNSQWGR